MHPDGLVDGQFAWPRTTVGRSCHLTGLVGNAGCGVQLILWPWRNSSLGPLLYSCHCYMHICMVDALLYIYNKNRLQKDCLPVHYRICDFDVINSKNFRPLPQWGGNPPLNPSQTPHLRRLRPVFHEGIFPGIPRTCKSPHINQLQATTFSAARHFQTENSKIF